MKRKKSGWITVGLCAAVVLAAFLCSTFFCQLAIIDGSSMAPTYRAFSFVLIDRRPSVYQAGDVIVFRSESVRSLLIKRVVACPGDRVRIDGGTLYVNGKKSPLYDEGEISDAGTAESEILLPDDTYFVLGDNLPHSFDNRSAVVAPVHAEDIRGRVFFARERVKCK